MARRSWLGWCWGAALAACSSRAPAPEREPAPAVRPASRAAPPAPAPGGRFAFSAVGDHGATPEAAAVLDAIPANGDFFLSLGDLSYGMLAPETAWCAFVRSRVGPGYPFAIVSGNHESDRRHGGGLIDAFVAPDCLPDPLSGVVGAYGKQYYFDVPADAPLARVIAISPGLNFERGGPFDYAPGTARHAWVAGAIDEARASGLRWVIVASHQNCVTAGIKACELGAGIFELLIDRRVDLILQGHDHDYQRSKQLAHGPGCPAVADGAFHPGCVADDGADDAYVQGAGSVLVINGTGGASPYPVSPADPEAPYFARLMTTPAFGLTRVVGTADRLEVEYVRVVGAPFSDRFVIEAAPPAAPGPR